MAYRGIKDWVASKAASLIPLPKSPKQVTPRSSKQVIHKSPKLPRRVGYREQVETVLGRRLRGWQVVHHMDEDRSNNDLSNLSILTRSEHLKIHRAKKPK